MVEAWFQTQGQPAMVRLRQTNYRRLALGMLIYVMVSAAETFIGLMNVATDAGNVYLILQGIGALTWMIAVTIIQINRGQGTDSIQLNKLGTREVRCFQLVTSGTRVQSRVLSMHLEVLDSFRMFGGEYENRALKTAGFLILISACVDVFGTILVVGLTEWAYAWLGCQVLILGTKVIFSLEPLREIPIQSISPLDGTQTSIPAKVSLPLHIQTVAEYSFSSVGIQNNLVREEGTGKQWKSKDSGIYVGQPYTDVVSNGKPTTRYLGLSSTGDLTLLDTEPARESNQAMQREFMAALLEILKANRVASKEFLSAVERLMEGVERTMDPKWFLFGSKDLKAMLRKSKFERLWRQFA